MAKEMTTAALLLEWDKRRPRSQQVEIGMSDLGVCQRRAGYILAEAERTNESSSVQAVMGTVIHAGVAEVCRQLQAEGLLPAVDLVEFEVLFAGVRGHLDHYESAQQRLVDTKSTNHRWLKHLKVYGPTRHDLWQINNYAAALVTSGRPVRELALDYLCRDCGEEWRWTGKPDPSQVRDALDWLRQVRETDLEWLPRDYEPSSTFCKSCPFLQTCWGDQADRDPRVVLYQADPDAARWAERLAAARADLADAKQREAEARGALDALRPNEAGTAEVDIGWEHTLRWSVSTTRRLDAVAVRRDYAAAGGTPPETESTSVRLSFGPPQDRPPANVNAASRQGPPGASGEPVPDQRFGDDQLTTVRDGLTREDS